MDMHKKFGTLLDMCVSSLRRGHANLLCIVPILSDDPRGNPRDAGSRSLGPELKKESDRQNWK